MIREKLSSNLYYSIYITYKMLYYVYNFGYKSDKSDLLPVLAVFSHSDKKKVKKNLRLLTN